MGIGFHSVAVAVLALVLTVVWAIKNKLTSHASVLVGKRNCVDSCNRCAQGCLTRVWLRALLDLYFLGEGEALFEKNARICIVGAGCAGLTVAEELRHLGYQVRHDELL